MVPQPVVLLLTGEWREPEHLANRRAPDTDLLRFVQRVDQHSNEVSGTTSQTAL
jgi:hypothetical protein